MSAELKVQQAILALLSQSPGIGYSVFDHTPDNQAYPYVVIGDDNVQPFDTKTFNGFELSVVIHTWSQYAGRKEIKTMQGLIYSALHNEAIEVAGYNTVLCQFEFSETFVEDDGRTRHGIQRFNVIITLEP
jgi:hypothetical protein